MTNLDAVLHDRTLGVSEIARLVGRTRQTIRNWRVGRTHPSTADVKRLGEALGLSAAFLAAPFDQKENPQ